MNEDTISKAYGVSMKALVFNIKGELLTLFRTETAPTRPNTWDLPGGDLDFGEEPDKAILREIKEEIGLKVEDLKIFDAEAHIIKDENIHWITLGYRCVALTTDVILSWEHSDYKWVTPEEFLKLESAPKLQRFVRNSIKQ